MGTAIVDVDRIEAFRRDGFVEVPGLLDPDELDRFGAAVDRAVERRTREAVGRTSEPDQSPTLQARIFEISERLRPDSLRQTLKASWMARSAFREVGLLDSTTP